MPLKNNVVSVTAISPRRYYAGHILKHQSAMVNISDHLLMDFNRLEKELEKAEKENQAHQKEVKI